jgi:hypothetical protein
MTTSSAVSGMKHWTSTLLTVRAALHAFAPITSERALKPVALTPPDRPAMIRPMSLNADRQRRLLAVFEKTMLREPLAREAYVDRACGDDSELRSDVMRLLALDEEVGSFFEHPTNLLRSAAAGEEHFPGTDRFRVLCRLGAGGAERPAQGWLRAVSTFT